jgi:uncharacterized repeat protein (TIGR01451 family)
LNIVVTTAPPSFDFDINTVTRRYYSLFPDDRDFLVIEDTFQRPTYNLAGYFISASNKDKGFGVGLFDNSSQYGSAGKLQGYVRTLSSLNAGLLNHELLHRWAAFLNDLGLSDTHWRAILRPSSGFGSFWGAYKEFRLISGKTYRAFFNPEQFVYSDLELYLMGLLDSANVAWPVSCLVNPMLLANGFDSMTQTSYRDFDADGIGEVSLEQIVAQYGERVPAPPDAQKHFELATIVVYDRFLSEVELAYFDMFAREYGKGTTSWSNFTAFGNATGGRADMSTVLPTPFGPDLALTMSHAGIFGVGTNGFYTLTVSNAGSATASGTITATDTLPAGLGYVSAIGSNWTCSAAGQVVTCVSTPPIAAGGSTMILLTVSVGDAVVPVVTNTATVSLAGDVDSSNNAARDETEILGRSPVRATLALQDGRAILNWSGGAPPYSIQRAGDLGKRDWTEVLANAAPPVILSVEGTAGFYRIVAH